MKVTQDFLYKYLQEHNIITSMIAVKMGVGETTVRCCFKHSPNRLGNPQYFSTDNIVKLNTAIASIAEELRQCVITFGSDQTYTNQHGTTYDPACVDAFQRIGEYFNSKALMERLLGWKKTKRDTILAIKKSNVYGNITQEDVNRVNAELLSVASVLGNCEVVLSER